MRVDKIVADLHACSEISRQYRRMETARVTVEAASLIERQNKEIEELKRELLMVNIAETVGATQPESPSDGS